MNRFKRVAGLWLGILACLATLPALAVERGKLPFATNLANEARLVQEKKMPVLILFSATGCHYCAKVRDEFLIPTTFNAEYDDKVILLEVEVGSAKRVIDFDGTPTTQAKLAQRYRIFTVPTVKLFDARGQELTEPLIGITTSDYYGGYLEDRLNLALEKLRK